MSQLIMTVTAQSMMVVGGQPQPSGVPGYVGNAMPVPPGMEPQLPTVIGGATILNSGTKVGNQWLGVTYLAPGASIPGMATVELKQF